MKRILALCALVMGALSAFAQHPHTTPMTPMRPSRSVYANQLGVKFDIQSGLSHQGGPELSFMGLEYSRYGWNNWGFRTGMKYGLNRENTFAVPLQVSWRATPQLAQKGRNADAYYVFPYERPRPDGDTHRYYYDQYHDYRHKRFGEIVSDAALQMATASSPVVFDLHAGLTPGWVGADEPFEQAGYHVESNFMCSLDAGARVMFQVWRFGLFLDVNYQLLMTRNFSFEGEVCSPHYVNVGAGLVYRF